MKSISIFVLLLLLISCNNPNSVGGPGTYNKYDGVFQVDSVNTIYTEDSSFVIKVHAYGTFHLKNYSVALKFGSPDSSLVLHINSGVTLTSDECLDEITFIIGDILEMQYWEIISGTTEPIIYRLSEGTLPSCNVGIYETHIFRVGIE